MPVLTVEFSDKMNDILQKLADKKGTTRVDILRRAVALYKYINNELRCRRAGDPVKKLVIRNNEDVILKEILVP